MIKVLLFFVVFGVLAYFGWLFINGEGIGGSNAYPVSRTLVSKDGRELDCIILGKKDDVLFLRRRADGRDFQLNIDKLSPEDAAYAAKLPSVVPAVPLVWVSDFEDAREEAKQRGAPVLVIFEGTGWCHACEDLERIVFNTREFREFAASEVVLYKAQFPKKLAPTVPDKRLRDRYRVKVFPTAVVIEPNGHERGRIKGADDRGTYLRQLREIVN